MTGKKKCVLVVEDNPAIRRMVSLKLKLAGFDVITAQDGDEAARRVESEALDVLLLDLLLPVVDGLEFLKGVRASSRIPVIAFSACTDLARKALELGADTFLPKPFDPDRLVEEIRSVLSSRAS